MDLSQAIADVRGFIVQITYTIVGLDKVRLESLGARGAVWSIPLGTGFVINDNGFVVTALHVVEGIAEVAQTVSEGEHIVGVGFAYPSRERNQVAEAGNFRVVKFDVVATDRRNDIALLKLQTNLFELPPERLRSSTGQELHIGMARIDGARPADGRPIAISGYPLREAVLITTAGNIASASSTDIEGALVSDGRGGYLPTDRADRYLDDVQSNPGNSGGPVYRIDDGIVIGMLTGSRLRPVVGHNAISTSANLAVIVPSRFVLALADASGVALASFE